MEPWIQTYTDKSFWPFRPRPEDIDIADIAHALSMKCRFNGHSKRFYSVAEHSVLLTRLLSRDGGPPPVSIAMSGLMHDAAEAYLADIPSPIKRYLSGIEVLEYQILAVIFEKFGCQWPIPQEVLFADQVMLHTEALQLMANTSQWSRDNLPMPPADIELHFWSPEEAESEFLQRFGLYSF